MAKTDGEPIKWGEDKGDDFVPAEDMPIAPQVTSRRVHKVSKEAVQQAKEEHVSLDWDHVFPKKPMDRLRWLYKAFEAVKKGKLKDKGKIFDIIVHRKFLDGLKGQIATDTLNLIRGNLNIFSNKQQKQLTSDSFELFRKYAPISVLDSDDDEADAPPLPPPPEVVIEEKKKRNKRSRKEKDDEDEEGASDDDLETKTRRKLSKGVERRVDPTDGQAYTLDEFIEAYGGTAMRPPDEWENARHSAFVFKS